MAGKVDMELARSVFETLCAGLDNRNWKYRRNDDKLTVNFGVSGEDIPMDFVILIDAERELIRLYSPMQFKISKDKLIEGAVAVCAASYGMADGSFDYDITDGTIMFRMTASYRGSTIGDGLIQYLISCSCATIDRYNDKFLALNKGLISLEKFLADA